MFSRRSPSVAALSGHAIPGNFGAEAKQRKTFMTMRSSQRFSLRGARLGAALWLLLVITAHAQVRVVAIGDVHGACPEFSAILQRTGLMDANRQWAGASAILIQTGDILDRGQRSRECLDLLMQLERQAERQHGKVIALLGNHEVMNIMGDLRYVSDAEYRNFATDQSGKTRERIYQDYLKFLAAHRDHPHAAVSTDEVGRQKWMAEHPPGFFEYRDAIGPDGKYGRWLRKHHAIVQVGDGLFMHGGLNPKLEFRDVAELDDRMRAELNDFDSIWQSLSGKKVIWRYMRLEEAVRQVIEELSWINARGQIDDPEAVRQMQSLLGFESWMIVSSQGPLWYRGLALDPEESLAAALSALLARLKAQYVVAGHTPQPKFGITIRFDHRVFLIDTGMLKEFFGGRASALEIRNGRFTAFYLDEEPQLLAAPEGGDTARRATPKSGHGVMWR
jgi:3',5'-cyclic AMP phosphodiesterase CpdA